MKRRSVKLAIAVALAAAGATGAGYKGPAGHLSVTLRVAPPLADPALAPGVGRCTSDGACTVMDAHGVRRGTPFAVVP